ncbi:MAG: hypothetical protein ABSG89_02160 [Bacteroidales bacterium]|jgi:hypothetical protein
MKKIRIIALILLIVSTLDSCATILGGKITSCQRTKPVPGAPARKIRVGYLIADIICFTIPCTVVDFMNEAIYKPCK